MTNMTAAHDIDDSGFAYQQRSTWETALRAEQDRAFTALGITPTDTVRALAYARSLNEVEETVIDVANMYSGNSHGYVKGHALAFRNKDIAWFALKGVRSATGRRTTLRRIGDGLLIAAAVIVVAIVWYLSGRTPEFSDSVDQAAVQASSSAYTHGMQVVSALGRGFLVISILVWLSQFLQKRASAKSFWTSIGFGLIAPEPSERGERAREGRVLLGFAIAWSFFSALVVWAVSSQVLAELSVR